MVRMGVVQVVAHQVIDMVPVRYGRVSAVGAVDMTVAVSGAFVGRRAFVGIVRAHLEVMLIDVIAMRMVQVAIV